MRLEMAGMAENKQKCLIFILVPEVRIEQAKSVKLVIKKTIDLCKVIP